MDTRNQLSRRRILTGAALGGAASLAKAQIDSRSQPQLLRKPFKPADGTAERNYFLYVPSGFYTETGREWPVILFLHGNGQRGNAQSDLDNTLKHGPLQEAWIQGRNLPFLIIQPQLPWFNRRRPTNNAPAPQRNLEGPPPKRSRYERSTDPMVRKETGEPPRWAERGTLDEGWDLIEKDLLTMISDTLADFPGDANRVYCTGLSYGGFGTWYMAQTYPERFAAVGPLCGAGDFKKMKPIVDAKLPIWIQTGGRDPVVPVEHVLASARALEAAGHPEVRMTVHEDLNHDVWTRVYEGDDLYNWLLRQRRP